MATFAQRPFAIDAYAIRFAARMGSIVLLLCWLAYVAAEAVNSRFEMPSAYSHYQAVTLLAVFLGYAVAWRHELAGGVIATVGTIAFFILHMLTLNTLPEPAAALFALPGVLFLQAWYMDRQKAWHGDGQS